MRYVALLAMTILAVGVARSDDSPVTIKVKKAGPGDVVKATKIEKGSNKVTLSVNGMDDVKDQSATSKYVYTEEVLERPAGSKRPTKVKRTYETAESEKAGEKNDLGLAGKTVLIEKSGDEYSFTIDGKGVSGTAAELLGKEFRAKKEITVEDFLPTAAVKVGGTWKVDATKLAKDLASDGLTADPEKSTATGKLVKVYDKGGAKFGVIEINMELAMTKVGGAQDIDLKAGSKMTVAVVLDMCIDGSRTAATTKVNVKADLSGSVNGADLKIELTSATDGTAEDVKKK